MRKQDSQKYKIIRGAEANMKAEGFEISRAVKCDCRSMIEGTVSANKIVGRYVSKHTSAKHG